MTQIIDKRARKETTWAAAARRSNRFDDAFDSAVMAFACVVKENPIKSIVASLTAVATVASIAYAHHKISDHVIPVVIERGCAETVLEQAITPTPVCRFP